MDIIKIENVNFKYEGSDENGLRNINLEIPKGQCVLITGSSGCGKTTLTRLVNGLIPNFYSGQLSGEIHIIGQKLIKWRMDELSTKVGSVFQNPRSQFFNLDTTSEIAFGCENLGWNRAEIHTQVQKTAEDLQITHLMDRSVFSLSGGEKQMLAIASAYAMGPDIFVMDEPSANLDAFATEKLANMISCLKREGKTILIAEHRLHYLSQLADRVLYIKDGGIEDDWTRKEFAQLSEEERKKRGLRSCCLENIPITDRSSSATNVGMVVQDISVCYKRGYPVLRDVSCKTGAGEIVAIIGSNGQGKSTFARCLCGLVKENHGNISYQGTKLPYKKRGGKIYLVMQEPSYQFFSDSVAGEVKLSFKDSESKTSENDRSGWVLKKLSLETFSDRHPMSLSGGEKQRLAIAAGIVGDADVMVLDEPTSGLDFTNMQRVKRMMEMLKRDGKLIFIITHDYEFLVSTCDRVLEIEDGRIYKDYIINQKSSSELKRFFLKKDQMI